MEVGNNRIKLLIWFCCLFSYNAHCESNLMFRNSSTLPKAILSKEKDSIKEYFKKIKSTVKESKLIKLDDLDQELEFTNLPIIIKLLERKIIDSIPNGKIISSNYNCIDKRDSYKFQIMFFDKENEACDTFKILEEKVNTSSYFEKPYKFFFRKNNMIFYITSDTKITCSSRIIEYLAKHLFNYDVEYSYLFYHSKRKRKPLDID